MLEGVLPWSFPQGSPFWELLTHCLFCNGLAEKTAISCFGCTNEELQQHVLISAWTSPGSPAIILLQQIITVFILDRTGWTPVFLRLVQQPRFPWINYFFKALKEIKLSWKAYKSDLPQNWLLNFHFPLPIAGQHVLVTWLSICSVK